MNTDSDIQVLTQAILTAVQQQSRDRWVHIDDVSDPQYLGKGWGRKSCMKWIEDGFTLGVHYRDDRHKDSSKPIYKINVDAVTRMLIDR